MINKIHVVGGPGSGKSYCGKKLSKKLNVNYINLDEIYYSNKSEKERIAELKKKLNNKKWLTEGHWHGWVEECFQKSDLIIYLVVNKTKRDFNLTKRWFKRLLNLEEGRKPGLRGFIEMIKINHSWKEDEVNKLIKKYKNKTQTFKTADEAIKELTK